jgi:hypothetical protein
MAALTREETEALIQEVLEVYPEKAKKDRAKHLMVNDKELESSKKCITSNRKSLPGVMTMRGCAYAGSKGVVWGPIKDIISISHGPIGCGQYSRAGRRNYYIGTTGVDSFCEMNFTSDFQEKDIVFGGDKKLAKLITEIEQLFPLNKGISIQSECPVGLIGDDIEAVAKKAAKELNKPVVPVRCEGFRGVSQSLGHHIANDSVRDWIIDQSRRHPFEKTPYDVAILGDYNIGGDAWASRILLEEMGLRVVAQWSGDGTLAEMENTPKRQAQPAALLPLDELHQPLHGREVQHPLARVQLLRPDQDQGIAAQDRLLLRRQDQGRRRARDRQIHADDGRGDRQVQAAPAGQEGHALRRRPASAPCRRRLRGPRHGSGRRRLRVRPQRRLRPHHQGNGRRHPDLRRRHRLTNSRNSSRPSSPT